MRGDHEFVLRHKKSENCRCKVCVLLRSGQSHSKSFPASWQGLATVTELNTNTLQRKTKHSQCSLKAQCSLLFLFLFLFLLLSLFFSTKS